MSLYYSPEDEAFSIADMSLLDNGDLPDKVKYQLKIMIQFELPVDTGNLRYNALKMLNVKYGVIFVIDQAEADYTQVVFEFYLYRKGVNFMYNAAKAVYDFLVQYFTGLKPEEDMGYKVAYRSIIGGYGEDNEARQVRNILHGSGDFASPTLKAQILGGKI